MTLGQPDQFGFTHSGGTIVATPAQRLAEYLANPSTVGDRADPAAPQFRGVPNPYGQSLTAFEPNTTPYVAETTTGGSSVADSTIDMPQGAKGTLGTASSTTANTAGSANFIGGGIADANGLVQRIVAAATQLAANHVPYVWGGTSASGVDCSGLIYFAAKAAGVQNFQRYVAGDYGKMPAVSADQARPGDIVYWFPGENGVGETGHVGIYLGNGMMVAAPQSGQDVTIERVFGTPTYHRVFNDSSFASVLTPTGQTTYSYNQRPMVSPAAPPPAPQAVTPPPPAPNGRLTPNSLHQDFSTDVHAKAV